MFLALASLPAFWAISRGAWFSAFLFALVWPDERANDFLRAGEHPETIGTFGFWLFFMPIAYASLTGLAGIVLVLNRRPERAERIRILALAAAVPFFIAGFLLPLRQAAIATVLALREIAARKIDNELIDRVEKAERERAEREALEWAAAEVVADDDLSKGDD